jgi:hypothetical protein
MLQHLTIEYVLEGYAPGYTFTTPTNGLDDDSQKVIWRNAFPRGQGWSRYIGARTLKCFPVKANLWALCEVIVTDRQDEVGRKGIRHAEIDLLTTAECVKHLQAHYERYPTEIHQRLDRKPSLNEWRQILDRALPKFKGDPQVILTRLHPSAEDWRMIEALVLKLALYRIGPIKRWGKLASFTTLALDYREESHIVAIPQQHTDGIKVPIIKVR